MLLWLLLGALFAASPVARAQERVCTITTLTDYAPFSFDIPGAAAQAVEEIPPGRDSLRLQGMAWDLVREALHSQGVTIRLMVAPWPRAMHYLETGLADAIFPAMHTAEREQSFIFSQEPVIVSAFVVYVSAEDDLVWEGLPSLMGRRIVGVRGWAFGDAWAAQRGIVKLEAYTIQQCFDMLDAGFVDGVVGYATPFDSALARQGRLGDYRQLPSWGEVEEYLMARDTEPGRQALDWFDLGIRQLRQSGRLEQWIGHR